MQCRLVVLQTLDSQFDDIPSQPQRVDEHATAPPVGESRSPARLLDVRVPRTVPCLEGLTNLTMLSPHLVGPLLGGRAAGGHFFSHWSGCGIVKMPLVMLNDTANLTLKLVSEFRVTVLGDG